jgi:hypothetical protein
LSEEKDENNGEGKILKPILFSTPVVRALLNTKPNTWPAEPIDSSRPYKWMTRRIVKPRPCTDKNGFVNIKGYWFNPQKDTDHAFDGVAPYGVSDHLLVRETFTKSPAGDYIYLADPIFDGCSRGSVECDLTPSIFMQKKAARIFLEVKNVRVERVQDINEEDAKAEGIEEWLKRWVYDNYTEPDENAYWISGDDEGFSYCQKCGESEITRLEEERPDEDFF